MSAGVMLLAEAALERIAHLEDDDARETALSGLARALGGVEAHAEEVAAAYRRILELSVALARGTGRARAVADVCEAIASARLPRPARGELLEHALELASASGEPAEKIDRARSVIEAMTELRWGDQVELLSELADSAGGLTEERQRTRGLSLIALAMANASDCERAIALLDRVPASGQRARCLALIAARLFDGETPEDAAPIIDRALAEARGAAESAEQALALRTILESLLETGMETPSGDALFGALDGVDDLRDGLLKRDALSGALDVVPRASLEPSRLTPFLARVGVSIDRVEEPHARGDLLGRLAVTHAALGDADACEQALQKVVALARASVDVDLVDTVGDVHAAIPLPAIVEALVEAEVGEDRLQAFALTALDLLRGIGDSTAMGLLLRQIARLFASPALQYERRVMILDKALEVARSIAAPDERVQVATAIANALSFAGAMERGDAFFAGLVTGADARLARRAHEERAVALVRLNRTADALTELAAASRTPGADSWHAVQELARTAARCGFVADALAELHRVDAERQSEAHAQLADTFADSTWIDPNLRVIGLEALAKSADEPAGQTIACLLAQVRILEGIGEPAEIVKRAFERTAKLQNRQTAAIYEQQLVNALVARISRLAG